MDDSKLCVVFARLGLDLSHVRSLIQSGGSASMLSALAAIQRAWCDRVTFETLDSFGHVGSVAPCPRALVLAPLPPGDGTTQRNIAQEERNSAQDPVDYGIDLSPSSLYEKVFVSGLGGQCLELHTLLAVVLNALGFEDVGLAHMELWGGSLQMWFTEHVVVAVKIRGVRYFVEAGSPQRGAPFWEAFPADAGRSLQALADTSTIGSTPTCTSVTEDVAVVGVAPTKGADSSPGGSDSFPGGDADPGCDVPVSQAFVDLVKRRSHETTECSRGRQREGDNTAGDEPMLSTFVFRTVVDAKDGFFYREKRTVRKPTSAPGTATLNFRDSWVWKFRYKLDAPVFPIQTHIAECAINTTSTHPGTGEGTVYTALPAFFGEWTRPLLSVPVFESLLLIDRTRFVPNPKEDDPIVGEMLTLVNKRFTKMPIRRLARGLAEFDEQGPAKEGAVTTNCESWEEWVQILAEYFHLSLDETFWATDTIKEKLFGGKFELVDEEQD